MAHNLPYYGYYKYDVIPWEGPRYDIELLCKNIEPRNQRHCRAGMTSKTIPTNL
ncbi:MULTISPECIES: hypothetical protein [unclassified Rickettsia]|uniref:hypothetical protein n=1 Tax=unclassified Rickettsia TaxID=114295 RepID=UPI00313311A5